MAARARSSEETLDAPEGETDTAGGGTDGAAGGKVDRRADGVAGDASDGRSTEEHRAGESSAEEEADDDRHEVIERPTELIRIGTMLQTLVGEVREMKLDEAGRDRLARIHERAVEEIRSAVSDDLGAELAEYALPLDGPSEAELRIAQAQLLGWLEGLMRGIQAAVASRQLAAQGGGGQLTPGGAAPGAEDARGTGQYL